MLVVFMYSLFIGYLGKKEKKKIYIYIYIYIYVLWFCWNIIRVFFLDPIRVLFRFKVG